MTRTTAISTAAAVTLLLAAAPATGAGTGGLSIAPAIVERQIQAGAAGELVVVNDSAQTIDVVATPRPWIQPRNGVVRPNSRKRLRGVKVSPARFTLAAGARRTIQATLSRVPKAHSLYGTIEVLGTPRARRSGVRTRLRLLASLRLNPAPSARRLRVQVGRARTSGKGARRQVLAAARNTGNTVMPITGSATIRGATGTLRGTIRARRILPGATVDLQLARGRLARGSYVATVVLRQGGRRVASVRRSFRVR